MQFHFTFEGNLGADPELSYTPTGRAACKLRVGRTSRRRTTDGTWVDGKTLWITVTAWGELAERLVESLRSGDTVTVEARDDLDVWAYTNQKTDQPAAQIQVTAANVSLSMRFNPATSRRKPRRPAAPAAVAVAAPGVEDDPWATGPEAFPADHATADPFAGSDDFTTQDLPEDEDSDRQLAPSV